MNVLTLPQAHRFIVGTTGTGKTMKFVKDFEDCSYGGIHINFTRAPSPFVKVNEDYEIDDLIDAMADGEKLNYYPALDRQRAQKETAYIVHRLFACKRFSEQKRCVFALDEAHILAPESGRNHIIEQVATTGRTFGIMGVFITQSPSMVEKILIRQSDVHVVFTLSDYERQYFKAKGMDFDKMQGMVRSADAAQVSHKYVVWNNGLLSGPYQDKI